MISANLAQNRVRLIHGDDLCLYQIDFIFDIYIDIVEMVASFVLV